MPLPKLEDWKAPWETKGEEIDADKAKAFIHSLLARQEKFEADLKASNTRADEALQAKDELQVKLDAKAADGAPDPEQARQEQAARDKKVADAEARATAAEHRALVLEVAAEKGLTAKQAKRLQGTSKEELEADADEILQDFAPKKDDDDPDDGGTNPLGRPHVLGGRNALDPEDGKSHWDLDKAVAQVPRANASL